MKSKRPSPSRRELPIRPWQWFHKITAETSKRVDKTTQLSREPQLPIKSVIPNPHTAIEPHQTHRHTQYTSTFTKTCTKHHLTTVVDESDPETGVARIQLHKWTSILFEQHFCNIFLDGATGRRNLCIDNLSRSRASAVDFLCVTFYC